MKKPTKKKPLKLRPAVAEFAQAMETILRENDYKGSVKDVPVAEAIDGIFDEARELDNEFHRFSDLESMRLSKNLIKKEAVDVANFALMAFFGADAPQ